MPGRLVILSDLHLGRPRWAARSAMALRPLWEDASRLILNGDVAELHHPQFAERAEQEVLELLELCHGDGVLLTLLAGNHDPYLSHHKHALLADDRVLVTHGDVFHPAIAPWSMVAPHVRRHTLEALDSLQTELREDLVTRLAVSRQASIEERNELARQASKSSMRGMLLRPGALVRVLRYWRLIPSLVTEFVSTYAPGVSFVIFGHTHHGGVWTIDGRTIINTGSFGLPGRPYACVIEGEHLELFAIRYRRGEYRMVARPCFEAQLPATVRMPSALKTRPVTERPSRSAT